MRGNIRLNERPNFGFEFQSITYHQSYENRRDLNLKRIGSYIPLLGTILGILDLWQINRDARGKKSKTTIEGKVFYHGPESYNVNLRKFRASIETLSFGIIFLPIDIAVTVQRKYKQIQLTKSEKQRIEQYRNSPDTGPTPAKLKQLKQRGLL